MIEFVPFHPRHLTYIKPHTVQTDEMAWLLAPDAVETLVSGPALSVWQSGVCLGAAGVVPAWKGRAEAWSIFADCVSYRVLRASIRTMNNVLDVQNFKRIDMLVRQGNLHGHVIAKLTGFEFECKLEAYHLSGDDMFMYKRIKR